MSDQEYYLRRAQECIRAHEVASATGDAIKRGWQVEHIRRRNLQIMSQKFWEKKLRPLSDEEAMALADISCGTDYGYKGASDDAKWYMQQATMYAAAAGINVTALLAKATGISSIPEQRAVQSNAVR